MITTGLVLNQELLVKSEAVSLDQGNRLVEIVKSSVIITPSASLKNMLVGNANIKIIVKLASAQLITAPSNSSYARGVMIDEEQVPSLKLIVRKENMDLDQHDMYLENMDIPAPKNLNANIRNALTEHANLKLI